MNFVTADELGKLVSELEKEKAKLKEQNTKYKKEIEKLIKSVTTYLSTHDTDEQLEIEEYWESLRH